MFTSTVTQKGQVTIPKKLRDFLNLHTNDKVIFVRRGENLVLKPVKSVQDLRGTVQAPKPRRPDTVREAVKKDVTRRIAGE